MYSPDPAKYDLYIFPQIKVKLKVCHYKAEAEYVSGSHISCHPEML
jgi:hypothetical protein